MIFELLLASDRGGCVVRAGGGDVTFADLAVTDLDSVAVGLEFADSGLAVLIVADLDDMDADLEFAGSEFVVLAVMDLEFAIWAVVVLGSGLAPLAAAITGVGALAFPRGADGLWN